MGDRGHSSSLKFPLFYYYVALLHVIFCITVCVNQQNTRWETANFCHRKTDQWTRRTEQATGGTQRKGMMPVNFFLKKKKKKEPYNWESSSVPLRPSNPDPVQDKRLFSESPIYRP